jgi:hypothetical protein
VKGRIGLHESNIDLALHESYIVGFGLPGVDRCAADPGLSFEISNRVAPTIMDRLPGIFRRIV